MKKLFLKFNILCFIFILPIKGFAFCGNESEVSAFNFRYLQSKMMVAALSCKQQAEYNKFIGQYSELISSANQKVRDFFEIKYQDSDGFYTNKFVTKLANLATDESIHNKDYCEETGEAFAYLNESISPTTLAFANTNDSVIELACASKF